jgi:hypothetical protein
MKLIKLIAYKDGTPIYINIDKVSYFYEVKQSEHWFQGEPIVDKYTSIGVTTDEKSDFKVKETPVEIIEKIRLIRNANSSQIV